ncbi:DUF4190 domain-containing protein [Salinibacterium sp. ZJ450]|uniref:DUF4190 domain-containing protein n=1 Tax=Salinibacterium sp. ZJ450 TaxID=2708338 RepID=UPI001423A415|nr:DUF4190 domain-containing protein [Salinibacterium sp. ZJ450]
MTTTDNNPVGAPASDAHSYPAYSAAPNQTLSILALVLGIVSLVFGQTFFIPVAAIVLGFLARTREPASRTMGTWGIVLGFVSLFGWLLVILPILFFGPFLLFAL